MSRPLPLLPVLLGAGLACGPPSGEQAGTALFADPHAVEVLTEAAELADPVSERPNRFFRGWWSWEVEGPSALLASSGGASLRVVTVLPAARTVSLDLLGAGGLVRAGHLEVRIDGGPPALTPAAGRERLRGLYAASVA